MKIFDFSRTADILEWSPFFGMESIFWNPLVKWSQDLNRKTKNVVCSEIM